MKTFAAINVGSYEQTLKIYTITKNNGIREVDWIRNRLDLGGTFATGKLSHEVMDELCAVLRNLFRLWKVIGWMTTAPVRRAHPGTKIRRSFWIRSCKRTGVKLDVLSTTEQRFPRL